MSVRVFPVAERHGVLLAFENDWGGGRNHQGNDIYAWNKGAGPVLPGSINTVGGSAVVAVDDGELTDGTNETGGNALWVVTSDGAASYYAHLESFTGTVPRTVKAGEPIGVLGRTGNAARRPTSRHRTAADSDNSTSTSAISPRGSRGSGRIRSRY